MSAEENLALVRRFFEAQGKGEGQRGKLTYDFFELEGGQFGLVVDDATGKGMPAAMVMATTCGMLRAVTRSSNSPGEVLRRVNEALSARIPPNMFVTCIYTLLDPETGSLTYANAGHDLPYLRRGDHADQLRARECHWA